MSKYRILQMKPEGFTDSFLVQESVKITREINPIYKSNQSYWESTFRNNAGGRPSNWFIKVDKESWKTLHSTSTLNNAEYLLGAITGDKTPFKPVVIKEHIT